jgi:molecular chaperone GrpE
MKSNPPKVEIASPEEVAAYAGTAVGGVASEAAPSVSAAASPAEELERLRAESKQNEDRLLRARAELQNLTRRLTEEKEAAVRYANAAFARTLLPVWDNFERTLASLQEHHASDPVIEGVKLVFELFKKALADQRIEPIEAVGKPFDPAWHEALMRSPTADHPEGTVLQEFERGFRMKERLLRAAKVVIAAAPDAGDGSSGGPAGVKAAGD